jgi:hypothetical protein
MKVTRQIDYDKVGTYASAICAVHCLITGIALGLLSVVGIGFIGSVQADVTFLGIAVLVATIAIVHGIRKHHSYKPALIFVTGMVSIVLGHFVFRHVHTGNPAMDLDRVLSTIFSVLGGLCFVAFHVVNQRMQKSCGCDHCSTGG